MHSLYDIIIWIGTGFIIISLLFSFFFCDSRKYHYLTHFYLITLITFLTSLNAIFGFLLHYYTKTYFISCQNILFILDAIFWYFFFIALLKFNLFTIKKIMLFLIVLIIVLRVYTGVSSPNFQVHAFSNLVKLILCLLYFNELFKTNLRLDLKSDPAFWIVTGLFFYCAVSFPVYAIHDHLKEKLGNALAGNIFATTNIAIIIMHLLFIKACICSIQVRKT